MLQFGCFNQRSTRFKWARGIIWKSIRGKGLNPQGGNALVNVSPDAGLDVIIHSKCPKAGQIAVNSMASNTIPGMVSLLGDSLQVTLTNE